MSETSTPTAVLDRPPASEPAPVGWAPLLVMLTGTIVTFLDFFIVNVALPSIEGELHAGPSAISLVVAGYGLTFAVGMITGGRLGDLYGRRRMFVLGLGLFTITSLACGVAPSAGTLVVARVAQGAAGALLTPQVLAVLGTVYTDRRRATAFAAYGFAMGIAAVLGQLLGGALIAADVLGLGWRAIFLINLPIGVVGMWLARRHVPESHGARTRLDPVGAAVGTAALVALVLPLSTGREQHWPAWTIASLVAAPILGAGFVMHQRSRSAAGRAPLVEPALFRARSFSVGSAVAFVFCGLPPAFFFVLALYLQQGRGYGALFSGVVFCAVGASYFLAMLVTERLVARLRTQTLTLGAVLMAGGTALLVAAADTTSALELVPGLLVVGFGIGLVLVPLVSSVLTGVDPHHAGAGAGVLSTFQQVGGAVGVTTAGTVWFAAADPVVAFRSSLWLVAAVALATAVLTQFLSPSRRTSEPKEMS